MSTEGIQHIPSPPHDSEAEALGSEEQRDQPLEEFSARAFSREEMGLERTRLATEIRRERIEGRDKLAELRIRTNLLSSKLERVGQSNEVLAAELVQLEATRNERANSLAGRFAGFLNLEDKTSRELELRIDSKKEMLRLSEEECQEAARELEESMSQLVDADTSLNALRTKITTHYDQAENLAKQPSIPSIMERSNAFFVHMTMPESDLGAHESFDMNNSNVHKATIEDEVDLILALEPSISTSSVVSGRDESGNRSGLWGAESGLLIAGGRISAASTEDLASVPVGLKERTPDINRQEGVVTTPDEIARVASQRQGDNRWNELIVNNPEAAGYFVSVREPDQNGTYWVSGRNGSASTAAGFVEELQQQGNAEAAEAALTEVRTRLIEPFQRHMSIAQERDLPFMVLTPDRRFLTVSGINENGSLNIAEEMTPEKLMQERVKMTPEKRKEIGRSLLERGVFRNDATRKEAQEIVNALR